MNYKSKEIQDFWAELQRILAGTHLMIAGRILEKLDGYNGCPSVVLRPRQKNALAKISLPSHSIHVTHEIIKLSCGKTDLLMTRISILAALVHDLSKPIFVLAPEDDYQPKDHAIHSAKQFKFLVKAGELPDREFELIMRAIEHHHDGDDENNPLTLRLKKADQRARQKEQLDLGSIGVGPITEPTYAAAPPERSRWEESKISESVKRTPDPETVWFDWSEKDTHEFFTLVTRHTNERYATHPLTKQHAGSPPSAN